MLAGYKVSNINWDWKASRVIEVCNYHGINEVATFNWISVESMERAHNPKYTIAIFKIKPKCNTSSSQPQ